MTHTTLLEFSKLTKYAGAKMVIAKLSASFGPGNFALLGPNGAGKSTLLSLLAGVTLPDEGEIAVTGLSLKKHAVAAKRQMAYVPDKATAYPFLTGRQFLELVMGIRKQVENDSLSEMIKAFGLAPLLDKRFSEMSLGTQKKMFLITAFVGVPRVILMDEPTNVIDDKSKMLLVDLIKSSCTTRLFLFATHDLAFANHLRARRVHLSEGRWG